MLGIENNESNGAAAPQGGVPDAGAGRGGQAPQVHGRLQAADPVGRRACRTSGEVGALLPKGPVYVAPDVWRKQRKSGALKRLGPAGCLAGRQRDPEIAELNRLLERPEPELRRARHLRRRQEK